MISKDYLIRRMKEREERNPTGKITPELRKMHEIFGDQNANCGIAAQYEDGTCSRIAYDPAKMSFTKRTGLDFSSTEPVKDYPTQAETEATKFLDFATTINDDKPRDKRWRNQK